MSPEFDDLRRRRYISLTTFRRSGEPVATPVWHAMQDGRTFVQTGRDSGKARRLRRDPTVTIAACSARGSVRGPAVPGRARILDGAEAREAAALLLRRYGWQKRVALHLARRRGEETILLEITPIATSGAR